MDSHLATDGRRPILTAAGVAPRSPLRDFQFLHFPTEVVDINIACPRATNWQPSLNDDAGIVVFLLPKSVLRRSQRTMAFIPGSPTISCFLCRPTSKKREDAHENVFRQMKDEAARLPDLVSKN